MLCLYIIQRLKHSTTVLIQAIQGLMWLLRLILDLMYSSTNTIYIKVFVMQLIINTGTLMMFTTDS